MKNLLCLVLTAAMLLALTACGGPENPPATEAETKSNETAAVQEETKSSVVTVPETENTEPVPTEKADPDNIQIDSEEKVDYENATMKIVVTATDRADGEVLWTYESPWCMQTELTPVEFLTVIGDMVYVNVQAIYNEETKMAESGGLLALNLFTGETLWENKDFFGASALYDTDREGNIYVSGYYGPDCVAISPEGKTLWKAETIHSGWFWPDKLDVDEESGIISITFLGSDEGEAEHVAQLTMDGQVR